MPQPLDHLSYRAYKQDRRADGHGETDEQECATLRFDRVPVLRGPHDDGNHSR